MTVQINRADFLQHLEAVQPGLSNRDILEQSSCFVFRDGTITTYNGEIACQSGSQLPKTVTGAVRAAPLLQILRKMGEELIELEITGKQFLVLGKKRRAGLHMEAEIALPIEGIEKAKDWIDLHEDFTEAIKIVEECAGKDESQFAITCINLTPKWVEACDNFQLARYRLKTGIKAPVLVRRDAIKHVVPLDMTQFSQTESWIHFRNPSGLTLSCRIFMEPFPDMSGILNVTGLPASLPKGLGDAADKAEVFSSENADDNQVKIEIRPGKLKIRGQGVSGWYSETKKVKYKGPPFAFMISPKLLVELTKKHHECILSAERLKVNAGRYDYVACLSKVDEKEE